MSVELIPSGHSIYRILEDEDRVGSLRENITLAVYEVENDDSADANLVMLQVSLSGEW